MQITIPWAPIRSYIHTLANRHLETAKHSLKVSNIAFGIGLKIGLQREELINLFVGALLHDIGKVAISDFILDKPGKLTDHEFEVIRQHPRLGYSLVESIGFPTEAGLVVLSHHERYDGFGYPQGLKGENIPLLARICAVADSFEAMTSGRPYRDKATVPWALSELERCRGQQFDPNVVDVFQKNDIEKMLLSNVHEVKELQELFAEVTMRFAAI